MKLLRLNPQIDYQYIGYEILFKTRGNYVVKKILKVNNSSIVVDHNDLNNQLQLSRKIHVIIE